MERHDRESEKFWFSAALFLLSGGINDGVAESTHRVPHQRGPQTRRRNDAMVWSTPEVHEVCVGMEVTSYLSAEM
jgi:coenzyme PQQ precursor peptide PqqA